ncbi:glycoside hydrolase family 31 protein [Rhodobacteraceae bacterium CCMM004]|nr:glycoside hydrolase family 31 protein [Rhodobacteraceae bacterium CCMM004]
MSVPVFTADGPRAVARWRGETIWLEPVGRNAVRVRATRNAAMDEAAISGLLDLPAPDAAPEIGENAAIVTNGAVRAELRLVKRGMGPALELRFLNTSTGAVLMEEEPPHILWPGTRAYTSEGGDLWRIETRFRAHDGERFHGLGQHQHGRFDQKGCVVDLLQANTEVVVPWLHSSRGYGVIWNSPGTGRVELAANRTLWSLTAAPQIDYVVVAGDAPQAILTDYLHLTGLPPALPDWALGFWQCKLRYETQDEVLEVARAHRDRGLPMDVMVVDFFHWSRMGEWRFDEAAFPDPAAMVAELREMGIETMVSVWPTVNANAATYDEMANAGYIVGARHAPLAGSVFYDRDPPVKNALHFYDATHPSARDYHWGRIREGYVRHGIRAFWLDANEPEMYPMHPEGLRYHAGDGRAVTNAYPALHQKGYAEAFAAEGIDGLMLSRSAWLGTQRHPVVVWSGDVASTFPDFARQVKAGLNMAMSGIVWWTTDIGGFKGGDIGEPDFRELLVRWFQWGAFCPVFRLHGFRQDAATDPKLGHDFLYGGAANEVWSYGPEVEAILARYLHLRERLRPYLRRTMAAASEGVPPLRPLFLDFPDDPAAWDVADAHLFGPDLLVAPVLEAGAAERAVYLPRGATWTCAWTGETYTGGQTVTADAPLDRIPLFLRDGATLPIAEES